MARLSGEDSPLWGPGVADHCIWHTVPQAHILWSASEVIHNPGHKGGYPPASPSACHPVELAWWYWNHWRSQRTWPSQCSLGSLLLPDVSVVSDVFSEFLPLSSLFPCGMCFLDFDFLPLSLFWYFAFLLVFGTSSLGLFFVCSFCFNKAPLFVLHDPASCLNLQVGPSFSFPL